jgi:hypothetical protein
MKKQLFASVMSLALLSSCSDNIFYQVYQVDSPDVQLTNNVMLYENDDCKVTYNLWAEKGNLSFMMHNKTDENLYLVMSQSFFILNGIANNYYTESVYGKSATGSTAVSVADQISLSGYMTNGYYWYPATISRRVGAIAGVSVTKSVQTKEPEYICIPPHSAKYIDGFMISDYVYKDCDNFNQNYPQTSSSIIRYSQDNSPLKFRNRLAYTIGKKDTEAKYLDHNFWVSSLQNYSTKNALSNEKHKECESGQTYTEKRFNMYSSQRFYNKYKKTTGVSQPWVYEY